MTINFKIEAKSWKNINYKNGFMKKILNVNNSKPTKILN